MKYKTAPAIYTTGQPSPDEPDANTFEAIVSVFNNADLVKDVVRPGAYLDTIAAWKSSGNPTPVYWSHRMDDPQYNIGALVDWAEVYKGDPRIPATASEWVRENGGLWVKGLVDVDSSATAAQAMRLLRKRRVTQFSFAYDVIEEKAGPDDTNELLKLWVHEVGPTPLGCNPLTELVGAKSQTEKPETPPETPLPTAADWRLRCDIAALWHAYAD